MSFLSYLINGVSLGSIYAIIALGYTMVYGIAKMLNFAHGDVIMIGAFVMLSALNTMSLPLIPAVLVAVVAAVGVAGVFWACVVFCLGHFVVPLWRLMLWFLRNVACNSPTRISNVEIAPLELQRFRALQKVRVPELHASFG